MINRIVYDVNSPGIIKNTSDCFVLGTVELTEIHKPISAVSAQVYLVIDPDYESGVYSRIQPELLQTYPNILSYTYSELNNNVWEIRWKFDPTAIPFVYDSQDTL